MTIYTPLNFVGRDNFLTFVRRGDSFPGFSHTAFRPADRKQEPCMDNLQLIERFTLYLSAERRYSPLTVRNYLRDIDDFMAWGERMSGGGFSLAEARGEDIRSWELYLADERRLKPQSINRAVASLRTLYKYMLSNGIITKNIFVKVSAMRTAKRLPKFVSQNTMSAVVEEVLRLLREGEWRERRDALLVLLLYACGLRLAEVVGIDRGDFTDDFHSLRVRGKGDKMRIVPLAERVRSEVLRYISAFSAEKICKKDENALFLSPRGGRISRSDVQRSVARLLRSCGVDGKCSPHVLRHTFATHLLNDGADIREIQELMGHTSLNATQVYTHNDIASLQRIYAEAHPRK